MPFLALNGTTFRIQSNGMGQKYNEHGTDRFRTFDGAMRVTRRGIYREWNGNTAILSYADAATLIALLVSANVPLLLTGDLVGDETVAVMPILISNDPIHTASGPLRRVVFTLHETPAALPADTTAPIYRFYQRETGLWTTWDRDTPALEGDFVGAWDDQMDGDGERFLAGGVNPTFLSFDTDYAPIMETLGRLGIGFGDQGWMSFKEVDWAIDDLEGTGAEIMMGVRLSDPTPSVAADAGLWFTLHQGGAGGGSPDATSDVFFPHPNGKIYEHFARGSSFDLGAPVIDMDQLICYNIVAFDNGVDAREWTVRLNDTVQFTESPGVGAINLTDSHFWSFGANLGHTRLHGIITDMVINAGRFTTTQRASWRDYILGVTDEPPLPE